MAFYHEDEKGYQRDKYENYASKEEVDKAVANGDLRRFNNDKFVYDPSTGQEYWADGTIRK